MWLFLIHVVGTIPKIKKDKVAKTLAFMPGFITAKIYAENDDDDDDDEDDEEDEDPFFLQSRPCVLYCEDDNDDDDIGAGMAPIAGSAQPMMVY